MKKILATIICLAIFISVLFPVSAAEQKDVIYTEIFYLEDGITVEDEIIVIASRSTDKTAVRKQTIKKGDTVIGIIAFQATFRYNGSTVSVVSKSVTQTDTYDGYNYKQVAFTSSGGTVTLEGKLTKLLVIQTPFTMSLTCDKNGNIST